MSEIIGMDGYIFIYLETLIVTSFCAARSSLEWTAGQPKLSSSTSGVIWRATSAQIAFVGLGMWENPVFKSGLAIRTVISSVQSLSHVWLFVTPWTKAHQASLSITNSRSLHKFMSIKSVMPSNHLICRPLLLLLSIFPSIRVFSSESALCITWPKYWRFSFNISPSMNTQGWSPLGWTGWISLQSEGLSRVFSNTTVQEHQFFSAQLSVQFNSHIHTWLLEAP